MSARALCSSVLLAVLLVTGVSASPAAAATNASASAKKHACANTRLVPDAGNLVLVRKALVCLHNRVRARNGRRSLAENSALRSAALGHSNDMVTRGYFEHESPEGGTFVDRIKAVGYARPDRGWTLGENIAWGTGELATPAALMRSWLDSQGHRENILMGEFREIGFGLTLGTPIGEGGLTVSADFGARF